MTDSLPTPASIPPLLHLLAGQDRLGERRGLGISSGIDFKLTSPDSGGVLILENTFDRPGGPPRHLHVEQDEWFYALEGRFIIEIGAERITLNPGDSVLAPRQTPHVWAHVGHEHGRILIAFFPAGKMEAFFRETLNGDSPPSKDPAVWRAYGMALLGPPLALE